MLSRSLFLIKGLADTLRNFLGSIPSHHTFPQMSLLLAFFIGILTLITKYCSFIHHHAIPGEWRKTLNNVTGQQIDQPSDLKEDTRIQDNIQTSLAPTNLTFSFQIPLPANSLFSEPLQMLSYSVSSVLSTYLNSILPSIPSPSTTSYEKTSLLLW